MIARMVTLHNFIEKIHFNNGKKLYDSLEDNILNIDILDNKNIGKWYVQPRYVEYYDKVFATIKMQYNDLLDSTSLNTISLQIPLTDNDYKLVNKYINTELYISIVQSLIHNYYITYVENDLKRLWSQNRLWSKDSYTIKPIKNENNE